MTRKEFKKLKPGDKVKLAAIEKMREDEWYVSSLACWAERVVTIDTISFFSDAITVVMVLRFGMKIVPYKEEENESYTEV